MTTAGCAVAATALLSSAAAAAPAFGPSPTTPTGWGSQRQAVGRYHVLIAQRAVRGAPSRTADLFALVLNSVSELTAVLQPPTAGELTVFMRKVKTGEPYAGSGILSLHSSTGNYVLYLTDLRSHRAGRSAVVNQGAFVGPPIGRLSGRSTGPGHLTVTVRANGIPTLHARLVRFSSTPTP